MHPRPLLITTVALCATLTLASCNNSPEAGHPNTAPTSTPPTPTPTAPSTPAYTPEEQAAITAATARYRAARAAIDQVMANTAASSRAPLEAAGLGGSWLLAVIGDVRSLRDSGWYQTGSTKIASLTVKSVKLDNPQPEVDLVTCIDSSKTVIRFQSTKKPVPIGASSATRRTFSAKLVFAAAAGSTTKKWFVIDEKGTGPC
ncbi:hypothetical protein OHA70_25035 [Kribbella sp. NBC_00382]|uniref:hypothetical protein n=1 Tax=Kribbella sp. NBC_00382 TaxID=2975967 RepID=UPI002E234385